MPGLEAPPGQEGVDEVLERLFRYGTTSLDRLSFRQALDEVGAQEWATTDFAVRVLHDHFARAVALLADHVIHPRLPEQDFRTVRAQLVAELPGRLESPEYLAKRSLEAALLPAVDAAPASRLRRRSSRSVSTTSEHTIAGSSAPASRRSS